MNGDSLVTRAELAATVKPVQDDISEIKADVKTLLAAQAGRTAVSALASRGIYIAATLASGALGALLAILAH